MAKVFVALAKERGFRRMTQGIEIEAAKDYAPKKTDDDYLKGNDVPWLTRFAKAGGKGIISGDVRMRTVPHERLALYRYNFIVIFFEGQWGGWDFCQNLAYCFTGGQQSSKNLTPPPRARSGQSRRA